MLLSRSIKLSTRRTCRARSWSSSGFLKEEPFFCEAIRRRAESDGRFGGWGAEGDHEMDDMAG